MAATEPLQGCRVLVVEDDFLVADVLMDMLIEAGAVVLGPVGSVEDALSFIDSHRESLDYVILDLDLHGEKSYPVAVRLASLNLPFIFLSGYGPDCIDTAYRGFRHCEKPFRATELLDMMVA